MTISLLLFFVDPGPVVPPFYKDFDSIDCHSIFFDKYQIINKSLLITCHTTDPVQYPPEYLPHFLSLDLKINNFQFTFPKPQLSNMAKIDNFIYFTHTPNIAGQYNVTLRCLNHIITNFSFHIEDIEEDLQTHSSMPLKGPDTLRITNSCVERNKILFFSNSNFAGPNVSFGGASLQLSFLHMTLPSYLQEKNATLINETSFLIPQFEPVQWRLILFHLLPISKSLEFHNNNKEIKDNKFFFFENPLRSSISLINHFSLSHPIKLNEISCFKKLSLPSFTKNVLLNDTKLIRNVLKSNFTLLRTLFSSKQQTNKSIALWHTVSILEKEVKSLCPNCTIKICNDNLRFSQIVEIISSSQIYIGNHFANLIHMIWMQPYKSAIIDVTDKNYSCNDWGDKLAKRNNLKYYLVNNEKCVCNDFICMPPIPDDVAMDMEKFRKTLSVALNDMKII